MLMKRLLIVRHAKSSWDFPHLSDFERPLNNRGKRDVPDMARRFWETAIEPQQLISSPATRALTTAHGFADQLGIKQENVIEDERYYHASSRELQSLIHQVNDDLDCIMIFGHNPGLTDLINDLSGVHISSKPKPPMRTSSSMNSKNVSEALHVWVSIYLVIIQETYILQHMYNMCQIKMVYED